MSRTSVSWPELVRVMGEDGARDMCASYGGIPVYIRQSPSETLLFAVGEAAARAICKEYGGTEIIPPIGPRKGPTNKERAIQMLEGGMSQLDVAIALRCHIRTVEYAAQAINGGKPKRMDTKNAGVVRLPICLEEANGVEGGDGGAR